MCAKTELTKMAEYKHTLDDSTATFVSQLF